MEMHVMDVETARFGSSFEGSQCDPRHFGEFGLVAGFSPAESHGKSQSMRLRTFTMIPMR